MRTIKEKKSKVYSHIILYAFKSWMIQITTQIEGKDTSTIQGQEYKISKINLGLKTHEKKNGDLQGSMDTICNK